MGDYYFNHSRADASSPAYSAEALADAEFHPRGEAGDLITRLKSHNWYTQNAAAGNITPDRVAASGKDDLFVFGRNIYQAACGDAKSVVSCLNDARTWLATFADPL